MVVAAALPLVVLAALVVWRRWPLVRAAWVALALTVVVAVAAADLDGQGLLVAVGKGAWTGIWILLIVVPALLLFQLADRGGAVAHLSDQLGSLAGTLPRQLLLFAWVVPSFVQGVAGFGVPIVVAAPMLVRAGLKPAAAVAAVLVGYHWSVTFGSMGSSFFVAAGTSGIDAATTARFAAITSVVLAVNAAVAGLLMLRRAGQGYRGALLPAAVTAAVMAAVLIGVVAVEPALGSTAAGLAGLLVLVGILRRRGGKVDSRLLAVASAPYLGLTVLALVGLGLPPVRDLLARAPALAPSFPSTTTGLTSTPAVSDFQPLTMFGHPWVYVLAACLGTWVLFRRLGWLDRQGTREALSAWLPRASSTTRSLLGLTILAAVMVEAGLMGVLADTAASALGGAFGAVSPVLGALGTALTGSTTASNALLAPLQAGAADQLGADVAVVLTGQTVGGNIGNIITPMNVAIAAATVGATGQESAIIRDAGRDAAVLLVLAGAATLVLLTLL